MLTSLLSMSSAQPLPSPCHLHGRTSPKISKALPHPLPEQSSTNLFWDYLDTAAEFCESPSVILMHLFSKPNAVFINSTTLFTVCLHVKNHIAAEVASTLKSHLDGKKLASSIFKSVMFSIWISVLQIFCLLNISLDSSVGCNAVTQLPPLVYLGRWFL